jgi:hypothetical protein
MLGITDRQRARYLLEVRAADSYKLRPFVRFNKRRYLAFLAYIVVGLAYFIFWGTLFGLFGFAGLILGVVITDLSWLRGRNKNWPFRKAVTNWDEVRKIAGE